MAISLTHYLVVAAILFTIGVVEALLLAGDVTG